MNIFQKPTAAVVLEDGHVFFGHSVGIEGEVAGELCFNTGMTGYQEIFTDPSYFGQIMVMASVHIGNYGVRFEESESDHIRINGLVCRNFTVKGSRPGKDTELYEFFANSRTVAVSGVDTRALVQHLRDHGAKNAILTTDLTNLKEVKSRAQAIQSMAGMELSSKVTCREAYSLGDEKATYRVAVLDLGVKKNILRCLVERDVFARVFPMNVSPEEFFSWACDGYLISNGPGDPAAMPQTTSFVQQIIQTGKPVFGICLGHQIIALSQGLETYKMHHGHRGINHPVINTATNKGEITSQNHGFAVKNQSFGPSASLLLTHSHLNDGTVAGLRLSDGPVFSVQYHPEAAPGPHDSRYLFDEFINLLNQHKKKE